MGAFDERLDGSDRSLAHLPGEELTDTKHNTLHEHWILRQVSSLPTPQTPKDGTHKTVQALIFERNRARAQLRWPCKTAILKTPRREGREWLQESTVSRPVSRSRLLGTMQRSVSVQLKKWWQLSYPAVGRTWCRVYGVGCRV